MGKGEISWRAVRLESLALLAVIVGVYGQRDASWLLFAALFLAPDLSAIGYLANPRIGAIGYNLGHSLVGPIMLGLAGIVTRVSLPVALALIWAAHIAFDRAIGYGFKNAGDAQVERSESPNASRSASGRRTIRLAGGG